MLWKQFHPDYTYPFITSADLGLMGAQTKAHYGTWMFNILIFRPDSKNNCSNMWDREVRSVYISVTWAHFQVGYILGLFGFGLVWFRCA